MGRSGRRVMLLTLMPRTLESPVPVKKHRLSLKMNNAYGHFDKLVSVESLRPPIKRRSSRDTAIPG